MLRSSLRFIFLAFCLLASLPSVGIPEVLRLHPGQESFPTEAVEKLARLFPEKTALATDLAALTAGYQGFIRGVEFRQGGKIYLLMKSGAPIIYDDGLVKGFEAKLDRPDLKDMLDQLYRPGVIREPFRPDADPGRFRVEALFKAVYGESKSEVEANLVAVSFCGTKIRFNAQNGAARALELAGKDLTGLLKRHPGLRKYIFPLGGTFLWRQIAGTSRLSPHSWGIAIDLNSRQGAYWRGARQQGEGVEMLRDKYPQEIVEVFESHGFIWGGKWSHFDLMHFEYRPELLQKWRLTRGTQGTLKAPATCGKR